MSNNAATDVDKQFQLLIQQGLGLQGTFDSEQSIEPRHIAIIGKWVNQALDLIKPAMPPDDGEFEKLNEIGQAYSNATSVLPGDSSKDIAKIRTALTRAYKYFRARHKRDFSVIEPGVRARACHGILHETWRFIRNDLLGPLKDKEDGRTKRTALLHSFGRKYCWVHSMVKLGNQNDGEIPIAEHALALAACLRAIFEIFLDMNLLRSDKIADGPEKFFSFEKVARHKIARKSLALDKAYEHLNGEQRTTMSAFEDDNKDEIDADIVRLWGVTKNGKNKRKPKRLEHWTGMTVIDRVKSLGGDCVRYYQHSYHYCNWCLHSGYFEFPMATKKNASLFCALTYTFANEMFLLATEMMMEEFASYLDVPALQSRLKKVKLRGAQILWDAAVKAGRNDTTC